MFLPPDPSTLPSMAPPSPLLAVPDALPCPPSPAHRPLQLESFLVEITSLIFKKKDELADGFLIDKASVQLPPSAPFPGLPCPKP